MAAGFVQRSELSTGYKVHSTQEKNVSWTMYFVLCTASLYFVLSTGSNKRV